MTETPLFSVEIKKPTIVLYGLDIAYTMIGILVYFVVGVAVFTPLHESLSWAAAVVALTVGAFAFMAVLLLGILVQTTWTRKLVSDELRALREEGTHVVVKYDWLFTRANDVWIIDPVRPCEVRFISEKQTWDTTTTTYGLFPKAKELPPVS